MFVWRLILAAAVVGTVLASRRAPAAECDCDVHPAAYQRTIASPPQSDSWIFRQGRYTHDPDTGARVAQYAMKPAIEPLDDPREVTSGYSRTRVVLRGADGSANTTYRVQSFGNGRGGLDAEWERFHDAWRGSTVGGGSYGGVGYGGVGYGGFAGGYPMPYGGWGVPGIGNPWLGYRPNLPPGYGFGPGYGQPDAGRLDPDAADGYRSQRPRVPDRQFFNDRLPPRW